MRAIGHLPDGAAARRFSDYLLVQRIPNQVEPEEDGRWTLWIHEDDHLAQAQTLLGEFLAQPGDARYRAAVPSARELREKEQAEEKAWRKRFIDHRSLWRGGPVRVGWLTALLAGVCIAVALVGQAQGPDSPLLNALRITGYSTGERMIYYLPGLPEVRSGQVWRLVTPVFLHFGVLHLLFNVLWLLDLGGMLETRQSSLRLAIKVGLLAAVSNLAQYFFGGPGFGVGGPAFGGMSGVVYGLFGYIWLRGKLDPRCGLFIDSNTAVFMVIWFFVCISGLVGPIANMAHGAGLGLGLLWGFLAAKLNPGE
jgi:GlpG protein